MTKLKNSNATFWIILKHCEQCQAWKRKKTFILTFFELFFSKNVLYSILVLVKCITEIIV